MAQKGGGSRQHEQLLREGYESDISYHESAHLKQYRDNPYNLRKPVDTGMSDNSDSEIEVRETAVEVRAGSSGRARSSRSPVSHPNLHRRGRRLVRALHPG